MSFRVKEYYSRIDWLVGKGGFGEVYYGYRLEPEEVSQTSQASRSNGQRSTTVSPNNSFTDAPVSDQVAIKLERVTSKKPTLGEEAKILRYLQGGEGIPKFHLFSHTTLPVTGSKTNITPPRANGFHARRSPLSSPNSSLAFTPLPTPPLYASNGTSFLFDHKSNGGDRDPYNALVMERLGDNLETIFRRFRAGKTGSDTAFYDIAGSHGLLHQVDEALRRSKKREQSPSELYKAHMALFMPPPYSGEGASRLGEIARPNPPKRAGSSPSAAPPASVKSSQPLPNGYPVGLRIDANLAQSVRSGLKGGPVRQTPPMTSPLPTPPPSSLSSTAKGWDITTIAWIGCQILRRLEYVHGKGLVHRDIRTLIEIFLSMLPWAAIDQKPDNLCLGLEHKRNTLYLLDFGMAQSYKLANGLHVPKLEESTGCVGTQQFMSYRCGGSRRDDIESFAYVMLYFYNGVLPWSSKVSKFQASFARSGQRWTPETIDLNKRIQILKERMIGTGEGLEDVPREIRAIFRYLKMMRFADDPDYHYLRATLQDMKRRLRTPAPRVAPSCPVTPVPEWRRPGYFDQSVF